MSSKGRLIANVLLIITLLSASYGCDPPHFAWPERIPDVAISPMQGETPFDRWKAARLADPEAVLIAGAATVDLTPRNPQSTYIAGYMPNKKATGVATPITGRILLLDDGKQTLVMIGLDFVGYMNDRIWDLRHRISDKWSKDIFVASTHTHAGPDTLGMWGSWAMFMLPVESGVDEGYIRRVERDIAAGVLKAAVSARPARLRASSITVPEGISENAHRWGYKDNELVVLQAKSLDGETIGTLVNYSCHAEFMGGQNSELSADFPAYLYDELEAREGGVAVFFNGSLGGLIVPAMPRHTENSVRLRKMGAIRAGRALAGYASQALAKGSDLNVSSISIDRRLLVLPMENEGFRMLGEKGIFTRSFAQDKLYSEVWRIDLGELSIASTPGEIFPSLGFQLKEAMPSRYKMVVGLANDEIGYIMSAEEWTDYRYEYERTVSVGERTGPLMMKALLDLYASGK